MHNSTLEVAVRKLETGIVIEAIGDVDLMTVNVLAKPLNEAVKATIEMKQVLPLTVDLRTVDFIDSAGLALLVATRKRLAPAGRSLQVYVMRGQQPDRVLRAGRFDTIMGLVYNLSL